MLIFISLISCISNIHLIFNIKNSRILRKKYHRYHEIKQSLQNHIVFMVYVLICRAYMALNGFAYTWCSEPASCVLGQTTLFMENVQLIVFITQHNEGLQIIKTLPMSRCLHTRMPFDWRYYSVFSIGLNRRSLWPAFCTFYLRTAFNNKPLVYLFLDLNFEFLAQYEKHLESVSKASVSEEIMAPFAMETRGLREIALNSVFCSEPKIILKISCIPGIC